MNKRLDRQRLARLILDYEPVIEDEEALLKLIKDARISQDPLAEEEKLSPGQRAADRITRFAGSWRFILSFLGLFFIWIAVNVLWTLTSFDPYPFILLNLALSCLAAIQAPIILMSQNRQAERDRRAAANDYKINLKSELLLQDMHEKLDLLLEQQRCLLTPVEPDKGQREP